MLLINGVTGGHLAFLSLVSLRRTEPMCIQQLGLAVWPLPASTACQASGVWPYDQEGGSHHQSFSARTQARGQGQAGPREQARPVGELLWTARPGSVDLLVFGLAAWGP